MVKIFVLETSVIGSSPIILILKILSKMIKFYHFSSFLIKNQKNVRFYKILKMQILHFFVHLHFNKNARLLVLKLIKSVAERLRRWTVNLLLYNVVGSNPTTFNFYFLGGIMGGEYIYI